MQGITTLPSTRYILQEEIARPHLVGSNAREVFSPYGFEELRTPNFVATELLAHGIGDDTDIVRREMYTFEDLGGKSITLPVEIEMIEMAPALPARLPISEKRLLQTVGRINVCRGKA